MSIVIEKTDKKIERCFIHCSASDNPANDNIETLHQWHVVDNGWDYIGYTWVILADGAIHNTRPIHKAPASQKGHNVGTVSVCLTGNKLFTGAQFITLKDLCVSLSLMFPDITFHGHCEVSNKTCPNFDYRRVLSLDKWGKMSSKEEPHDVIERSIAEIEKHLKVIKEALR
jgi:N-acetylmuramoyl-L-alanine amidase